MEKAKVDLLITMFSYGGNGGLPATTPDIGRWLFLLAGKLIKDERLGRVHLINISETPITMSRNMAVKNAQQGKYDLLLMIDSDLVPDLNLGLAPWAKPFWDTSFDFVYQRLLEGKPSVVAAPYCGPPPDPRYGGYENPYVFKWETFCTDDNKDQQGLRLIGLSRQEAFLMRGTGIREAGALPTGLILYSMGAFDLMQPPYFKYEWTDKTESQKGSTEDVYNTREISLAGCHKYGHNIVFCNHDAWAGHCKTKIVGTPDELTATHVSASFAKAVMGGMEADDRLVHMTLDNDYTPNVAQETPPWPTEEDDSDSPSTPTESEPEDSGNGSKKKGKKGKKPVNRLKRSGVLLTPRLIGGHRVDSIFHQTPDVALESLTQIVRAIANSRPDKALRIVEIGSWVGETAIAMVQGFGPAGGTVYCVDHFEGSYGDLDGVLSEAVEVLGGPDKLLEHFKHNCGRYYGKEIKVIKGKSVDIAEGLDPQDADIIFIDAAHDYESVVADLNAWLPHLSFQGVMVGDDYYDQFPGVVRAVNERFHPIGCNVRLFEGTNLWMVMNQERLACEARLAGGSHVT